MFYLFICFLFIAACSDDNMPENRVTKSISKSDVIKNYARNTFYSYKDSLIYGKILQNEIKKFIDEPNEESFAKAKKSWLDARVLFSRSEMFSIHHDLLEEHSGLFEGLNGNISHDIIDYTHNDNESGIINSPDRYSAIADFIEIKRDNLIALNRHDSEIGLVVTGYHAIEFLLWGEDHNTNQSSDIENNIFDRSMIGSRPVSDYTTHKNAKRRAQYLKVASEILVDGLSYITKEWDPNIENGYDDYFNSHDADEVFAVIYDNMANNIEYFVFKERFFSVSRGGTEHSPFSDNSLYEIRDNIHGLQFVYTGHYIDGSGRYHTGVGLRDYISLHLSDEESDQIDKSYKILVSKLSMYIDEGHSLDVSHSLEEIKSMDAGFFSSIGNFFKGAWNGIKAVGKKVIGGVVGLGKSLISSIAGGGGSSGSPAPEPAPEPAPAPAPEPAPAPRTVYSYPPPASPSYYPTPQSAYSGSYPPGSYGPAAQRPGAYQPGPYQPGPYNSPGTAPYRGGYAPVYRPVLRPVPYYGGYNRGY